MAKTWDVLVDAARFVDRLPVSPVSLSEKALHKQYLKRKNRAKSDKTWADIEARRQTGGPTVLFLSEDLSLKDWDVQRKIEEKLTPEPRWESLARRAKNWSAGRLVGEVKTRVERADKGWSEADVWEMASYLPELCAGMLENLAENANGWPCGDKYPTYEDWTSALKENAAKLRGVGYDKAGALHEWYELSCSEDADPEEEEAARKRMDDMEAQIEARKREGFVWVAENLPHLWD